MIIRRSDLWNVRGRSIIVVGGDVAGTLVGQNYATIVEAAVIASNHHGLSLCNN